MRSLRTVVFIITFFILLTQLARHAYIRFIEPRTSVLDRFDATPARDIIQRATSLEELVSAYETARQRVDELDEELRQALSTRTEDEYYVFREQWNEEHEADYQRERELRNAVGQWERRSGQILELRVFWLFGIVFFLMGMALQWRGGSWLGMAFIISGLLEMVWWTSQSFHFAGSPVEFDRLLENKLIFTAATWLILLAAWYLHRRQARGKPA